MVVKPTVPLMVVILQTRPSEMCIALSQPDKSRKKKWKKRAAAGVMVLGAVGLIGAIAGNSLTFSPLKFFVGLAIPGVAPVVIMVGAAVGGGIIVSNRKKFRRLARKANQKPMSASETLSESNLEEQKS